MENNLLASARAAAAAGAECLRGLWGGRLAVEAKSSFDFVTNADRASQAAVLGVIRARHPDHAILAEEDAQEYPPPEAQAGVLWVVDPLDGTTNFIHGIPHVAVSVGVLVDGRPAAGVIVDVTRGEEFWGLRGGGSWLGERPIRVSGQTDPGRSLLLTGFPFRDKGRLDDYLALFAELFRQVSGVRRAGAAALDLAYVAAGRAEGFWEMGLKPWDLAAGLLLVAEAGGLVSDFAGGGQALWRGDVVAAAPAIHGLIQAACARRFPRG